MAMGAADEAEIRRRRRREEDREEEWEEDREAPLAEGEREVSLAEEEEKEAPLAEGDGLLEGAEGQGPPPEERSETLSRMIVRAAATWRLSPRRRDVYPSFFFFFKF